MTTLTETWPPRCCVPAFVEAAIRHFGIAPPDRKLIAKRLSVAVMSSDPNPWGFPIVNDIRDAGVKPREAVIRINELLRKHASTLRCRHVPFSTIAFGLYEEVLAQALERDVSVGIGLDWRIIDHHCLDTARHLIRVLEFKTSSAVLVDDSYCDDSSPWTVDLPTLEQSVNAVSDGFWMVGPVSALSFAYTIPINGCELE
jgi:hypothetical protein